ncbi:GGDEF domain-containing protein [Nitratireductor sp. GISD-1A_MAKvit]|uniref:GGDEF domain-containing protein n=1 Tax=Nitratireductor sp. GISD-1A_MAKvit TaxID=3234198 RepID=UPI003465933A
MENSPAISLTGLIGPTVMLVFSVGFIWVWIVDRKLKHAMLLAGACALFGLGMMSQTLQWPSGIGRNALFSGFLYTLAVVLASAGILRRAGKEPGLLSGVLPLVVIMALLWYFAYVQPNLLARIYVQNFSYGAILLTVALRINPGRNAGRADHVLFWVLLAFALQFFPRTILTAERSLPMMSIAPGDSLFWQTLQLSLSVMGAALALTVLATILTDVMDELRRDRDRDGLTGVLNRRGFEEQASRHASSRRRAPLSLIVCDLDHFKQINDTHGHSAGDLVLKSFGSILLNTARSSDIVGRIGGEEFALLLPNTDLEGARDLAERLRQRLSSRPLPLRAQKTQVSASFGVVEKRFGEDLDRLLNRADSYLYHAKHLGRNRIVTEPADKNGESALLSNA